MSSLNRLVSRGEFRKQPKRIGARDHRRRRSQNRIGFLGEQLEDRTLLTTITWQNAAGGDWNTGANWQGGTVPGIGDDAVIPDFSPDITITYSSGTSEIQSLTSAETLQISGGSFQIDAASTVNNITLHGGTFTGGGALTVSGTFSWTGGTQSGTGETILASGSQMNIAGAVTAGRPIDNTVAPINWTSGNILGTFNNAGQLIINNGPEVVLSGTLNNSGYITWTGSNIFGFGGGTLNNQVGATFEIQGHQSIAPTSGSPKFINAGTVKRTSDTGVATVNIEFDNSGTVQAQLGKLILSGGGTQAGNFDVSLGATLMFSGGTHTLGSGTTLTGDGTIIVSGGTTAIGAPISVVSITQSGGTLAGDSNLTVSGTYTWTGGTQSGTGETILASGSQMNIAGAVTAGRPIDNTVAPINWTSGNILGTFNNAGQLIINNGPEVVLSGTLNNSGYITWTGSNIFGFGGGTLNNQVGATFEIQGHQSIAPTSGSPKFINAGTVKRTSDTGAATINIEFDNSGTVQAQLGKLTPKRGGTQAGNFDVSLGATLMFSGGTHTLGSGTTLTGDGTIIVSGGTTAIGAPISVVSITQSGGTLAGDNDLTVSGTYTWTGGTQSGTGETILASGSQMNIAGSVTAGRPIDNTVAPINWTSGNILGTLNNPGQLIINNGPEVVLSGTLNNSGYITWTGSNIFAFGGGTLNNQVGATFEIQGHQSIAPTSGSPKFINAGTVKRTSDTGLPPSTSNSTTAARCRHNWAN